MSDPKYGIVMIAALWALTGCGEAPPIGAPLQTSVQRLPWKAARGPGVELQTEHYRIFTNIDHGRMRRTLPGFMEAAHEKYRALTGLDDLRTDRASMYMLASRADWADLSQKVMGPGAKTFRHVEAGGYTYRSVTVCWNIGGLATYSVAAHEGMHQFLHRNLRNRLPAWADEGLATVAEGFTLRDRTVLFTPTENALRHTDLRRAILAGKLRGLRDLLNTRSTQAVAGKQTSALGYYGQLWALMNFLRQDQTHRAGLARMLADAFAGRLANSSRPGGKHFASDLELFTHYITPDLSAFDTEYQQYARKLAGL